MVGFRVPPSFVVLTTPRTYNWQDLSKGVSCDETTEQWEKTAEHDEYDHYSMYIMFRHLALHDLLHAYRIEEILLKKDWD